MTKDQIINEINNDITKIRELWEIAFEYNQNTKTRTELSQKCTTYLGDVWQTLAAIRDEAIDQLIEEE